MTGVSHHRPPPPHTHTRNPPFFNHEGTYLYLLSFLVRLVPGNNDGGQLGYEDALPRGTGEGAGVMGAGLPVVDLGRDQRAIAVAAGFFHTCAMLYTGVIKCWGGSACRPVCFSVGRGGARVCFFFFFARGGGILLDAALN